MPVLPESGFLRISQIVGNPRSDPPTAGLIPIGRSSWWQGVRTGIYPAPLKLGPKTTVWRVEDVRALIDRKWPGASGAAVRRHKIKG